MKELPKIYDPQQVEGSIYEMWQKGGYFHAKKDPDKKPFTIVMPATQRHRAAAHGPRPGLTRCRTSSSALSGCRATSALWLPGTDHAGIATEIKVVEELREGGPDQATTWAGRSSWSAPGSGRSSTAAGL